MCSLQRAGIALLAELARRVAVANYLNSNNAQQCILFNQFREPLHKDIEKLNDKQDETKKQARKIIQQVQPNYMSKTIDD